MKATTEQALTQMINAKRFEQDDAAKNIAKALRNLEREVDNLRSHCKEGYSIDAGALLGYAKMLQDAADSYKSSTLLITELEHVNSRPHTNNQQ